MAAYSAYLDDAGHPDHPENRYLIVAGAIAELEQWKHLERECVRLLERVSSSIERTFIARHRKDYRNFVIWPGSFTDE
jgi:hypothetical protein